VADLATLGRGTFGRLVAQLANEIGRHHVDLAEDAVQEAFAAATRTWPTQGEPTDPAAWLYRVAKNRAIDGLRRAPHEPLDPSLPAPNEPVAAVLGDPELALVFLCCHPTLGRAAQVTLTLKVAAGFSVAEIARLFRTEPDAIEQRLVRSKRALRALGREVELLPGDLPVRLDAVLEVLYGMFSEGYSSISAPDGIRADLCRESLRLVGLLLEDPRTASAAAGALGALFAFHHARLAGRVNDHGQLLLLRDQDRSRWDQAMIARGLALMATSAAGSLTRYHLEAEIASCHAVAPRYAATDWDRIVELYTLLERGWPSAPVALNRAIAIGERDGPSGGLVALDRAAARFPELTDDASFLAARAEVVGRLGDAAGAEEGFRAALARAMAPGTRRLLAGRAGPAAEDVGSGGGHPSDG
jgi:RNA polymerase sigma-70 factor (ECF subfamily)